MIIWSNVFVGDECDWPRIPEIMVTIPQQDIRKQTQIYTITSSVPVATMEHIFNRHSSWDALKRSVALILRVNTKLKANI
jgi:hypothetical protein